MFSRACRSSLAAFAMILIMAVAVGAAEFQADMTINSNEGGEINGKVFVRNNSMRQEMETPMGQQVVIVDGEAGMMYILLPGQKIYVERPNTQVMLGDEEKIEVKLAEQGEVTKLGSEKVNNYDCEKINVVYNDTNLGESTLWVAEKLNYPIKIYVQNPKDTATIIYSNIIEKQLKDTLFVLPAGYTKLEMDKKLLIE